MKASIEELKDKLLQKQNKRECLRLLFEWSKTNHISCRQFIELNEFIQSII